MKYIYTLCAILLLLSCKDHFPELQKEDTALQENSDLSSMVEDEDIFNCPFEQMPVFPGGNDALEAFLHSHLRYPKTNTCVNGVVYVTFMIKEDGNITEIAIAKSQHEAFNTASMRVVALMPRWKPGEQSGMRVPVRYTLPIRFGLSN